MAETNIEWTRVVAAETTWEEPQRWNKWAMVDAVTHRLVTAGAVGHDQIVERSDMSLAVANASLARLAQRGLIEHRPGSGYAAIADWYRPRVFCSSLADVFECWDGPMVDSHGWPIYLHQVGAGPGDWEPHPASPGDAWRPITMADVCARLFATIDATPNLDWLLLTNRPENIQRMWCEPTDDRDYSPTPHSDGRHNVWIGTSVSTQADADRNIPELIKCRDLARCLFVSYEPALGPVDFSDWLAPNAILGPRYDMPAIDWVIVGGESGPGARPCNVEWIRSIVEQCKAAGVPCFVKQLGRWPYEVNGQGSDWPAGVRCYGDGSETVCVKLHDKKGGDPAEWPEDLRVREFPAAELSTPRRKVAKAE